VYWNGLNPWLSHRKGRSQGTLMVCTSYLVYSQFWLNFPRDDRHFFDILLWTIVTLATKKQILNRRKDCSSDSGVVGTACGFHGRNVHPGNYIRNAPARFAGNGRNVIYLYKDQLLFGFSSSSSHCLWLSEQGRIVLGKNGSRKIAWCSGFCTILVLEEWWFVGN
jgi:hypothetical protein